MKNKNKRLVIALILSIIIFALIISVSNKELNIQGINNKQQAVQLNEEYTKEDFVFDETGKILNGFSDKGKEKYIRNGYKLILDGNVLGNIEEIGQQAFTSDNTINEETYKKSLKELEFRNLESLKVIGITSFSYHSLEYLDLSPLKNLEKIDDYAFYGNWYAYTELKKKMKINFSGLEKLKEIGGAVFKMCGIEGSLDLSALKNLRLLGEAAFATNNITDIKFNPDNNLLEISSGCFSENPNLKEVDLTKTPNIKTQKNAFDEETKIKLTYNQYRYMLDGESIVDNYVYYYSTGGDNKYKVTMLDDYSKKYIEMNNEIQEIDEKVQNTQEQMSKLFLNENESKAWLENKGFSQKENNIMQEIENKSVYVMSGYRSELNALKPWEKSDEEIEQGLEDWKTKRDEFLKKYNDYKNLVLEELDTKIKEEIEKLNTELGKIKEDIKTKDNSKEIEDGINELKGKCILQSSIDNLKTKLENLKKFQKTVSDNITQLDTKVTELSTNNQERIKENAELNTLMKNLTDEVNTLKEYKLNLENKIKKLETEINKLEAFDCEGINADLSKIEKDIENLENNHNSKKNDIDSLNGKLVDAEKSGKVTEDVKQGLLNDLTTLETKQNAEKKELERLTKELEDFKNTNGKVLEIDINIKAKADALATKIKTLKENIEKDDITITDLKTRIEKLEIIDPAKEKAKEELNTLKQEVDTKIPEDKDAIKAELDKINTEVDNEVKDGVIKKTDKEAIQKKLDDVQKEIEAEKAKVQELQKKLDKIKEDNKGVITDAEIDKLVKEIQDKITKENNKITANETYKGQIENKLNKIQVMDIEKLTADLDDIEKRTNELENNDNAKKSDITKFEEEVKTAETNTGTDVLGKKKLEESIADIKKRQENEKAEINTLEKELNDLIAGNEKGLISETDLKTKADALKEKINNLKETIEKDDTKIKELENRIGNIKVLDVKDIEKLQKKVADLESINKKANEDIAKNQKKIEDLNQLIEKLKKDNKEAVDKLTKEKADLEATNKELDTKNKELNDTITELKAQIEQLNNLKEENKDLNDKIANLEAKVLEAEAKQNDLNEKLDKCSKHGKDLEEQIKELEKTIQEQDEKIKKLEQEKKDLEKRNKELEEKNKLNEEELKEKELLEKKIKELEEKVRTLEAEKEELAKKALEKEKEEKEKNEGKDLDKNTNNNTNNSKPTTKDNTVASKNKKNNSNNTSNNKIPHAGAGSVIILTIITAGAIVYTRKIMANK